MERTATQCITYGLYMLSTVWEKKANGCIIDTCMQISHEPVQIAIAVSNQSYTMKSTHAAPRDVPKNGIRMPLKIVMLIVLH